MKTWSQKLKIAIDGDDELLAIRADGELYQGSALDEGLARIDHHYCNFVAWGERYVYHIENDADYGDYITYAPRNPEQGV